MTKPLTDWPLSSLIPHSGNMVLLDELCEFDDEHLVARTRVKPGPYSLPDGALPSWLGLELMAQAVAAWAGCHARRVGQPAKLGFLLGTRRYESHTPKLPLGAALTITAKRSFVDESGLGSFECSLHEEVQLLAAARLSIYQPLDPEAFIQETE